MGGILKWWRGLTIIEKAVIAAVLGMITAIFIPVRPSGCHPRPRAPELGYSSGAENNSNDPLTYFPANLTPRICPVELNVVPPLG